VANKETFEKLIRTSRESS